MDTQCQDCLENFRIRAFMMIARGEISGAKTIIALQHLALLKSRGVEF